MPPEDPPEIENEHLTKQAEKNALREASQNLSLPVKRASNLWDAGKKHIHDDMVRSAGDFPISNLSKRPRFLA